MGWSVDFFDRAVMREFQRWPVSIRAKFTWIVNLIETHGPMAVGMPHVKSFGKELFEKRKEGIGRAIFCLISGQRVIILNGFIKKTDKTPTRVLRQAIQQMKEVLDHEKATQF